MCDQTRNINIGNTAATAVTARGGTKRLVGKWQVSVCLVLALGAIQLPNICYKQNTRVWSRTNGLFSSKATSARHMLAYKLNISQVDLIYFNLSCYPPSKSFFFFRMIQIVLLQVILPLTQVSAMTAPLSRTARRAINSLTMLRSKSKDKHLF